MLKGLEVVLKVEVVVKVVKVVHCMLDVANDVRCVLKVVEVAMKVVKVLHYMLDVVNGVRCVLWVLGVMPCMLFCILGDTLCATLYAGGRGG